MKGKGICVFPETVMEGIQADQDRRKLIAQMDEENKKMTLDLSGLVVFVKMRTPNQQNQLVSCLQLPSNPRIAKNSQSDGKVLLIS